MNWIGSVDFELDEKNAKTRARSVNKNEVLWV